MKVIGLIGGMSWESSAEYYRLINQAVRDQSGPLYSAQSLMYTVNFDQIAEMLNREAWDEIATLLTDVAQRLERGGAECLLLCTNAMHLVAPQLEKSVGIPLFHIVDIVGKEITKLGLKKVGLIGTAFTMEKDFYKERLSQKFGLEVMVPVAHERRIIHQIIFDELVQGKVIPESKAEYLRIMQDLVDQGAEGIILGCTEIMLLINQADSKVPVFDTTSLHTQAAVNFALRGISP